MLHTTGPLRCWALAVVAAVGGAGVLAVATAQTAAAQTAASQMRALPEIRTSPVNRVPACVTPERLMAFIASRNQRLPARLSAVASAYRDLGDSLQIRWDYAFFQMVLETNYLMYRRGDGSSGDVGQAQNNFAGIGATGGGVPGDQYPDVRTGVLAHMQHLVAYSGERVDRPVARRTREAQDYIIDISRKLGRRVTFSDLSRRWAVDGAYARNIEAIADLFRRTHCAGGVAALAPAPAAKSLPAFAAPNKLGAGSIATEPQLPERELTAPVPAMRFGAQAAVTTVWRRGDLAVPSPRRAVLRPQLVPSDDPAGRPEPMPEPLAFSSPKAWTFAGRVSGAPDEKKSATPCRVYSASYGGTRAVLIRSQSVAETRLTAVVVADQRSQEMAASFVTNHAPGGQILGEYDTKVAALSAAHLACAAH